MTNIQAGQQKNIHTFKTQNVSARISHLDEFTVVYDLPQNSTEHLSFQLETLRLGLFVQEITSICVADDKGSVLRALCSSVSSASNSQTCIGHNCHLRDTWHPAFLLSTEVAFKACGVNGQGPVGWPSCRRAP